MSNDNIFERLSKGRPPKANITDSELARDVQRLHEWLQHLSEPIICLRDVCYRGPGCMRNRKKANNIAEILVGNGWLVPVESRRRDTKAWRIVRGRDGYPTEATTPVAPLQSS